jgi:hypothetical protein
MFGKDRRPRVKGIDPVLKITPYVMPMRCDAQVFLKHRRLWSHVAVHPQAEKGEGTVHLLHADHRGGLCARGEPQSGGQPLYREQAALRPEQLLAAFTILKDPNDADKGRPL